MHKRSLFITVVFLAFAVLLMVAVAAGWLWWRVHSTGPLQETRVMDISKGASLKSISRQAEEEGIIGSALAMELYGRIGGRTQNIQAGEYEINPGSSIAQLFDKLNRGEVVLHTVTIPEGLTNFQVKALFTAEPLLSGEVRSLPAEGYLLPETYKFTKGTSRQDMVDRLNKAKEEFLKEAWAGRSEGLPFSSKEEAVILASIVEKETARAAERANVAGVFINRLEAGMRLQSDPTVIYALTGGIPQDSGYGPIGRRLLKKDLGLDSPYNTYRYAGLPPGAICNPGRESVLAVLHPIDHDYFYFVADGRGGHAFSKTLSEHNKNVAAWRKMRP